MKKYYLLIAGLFLTVTLLAQYNRDIVNSLYELPDVIFKKIDTQDGYQASFELNIKQVVDHTDPLKGFFYQRAYLNHLDFDKPMVFITEGYSANRNYVSELSELLQANQIIVEHRYFGKSIPDTIGFRYLDLKQATSDLNFINQLFKRLYKGKWISTGISKGGATSIFYRYFYPEDVDVSVPYVAPVNYEFEEKRIYTFLDTIGDSQCRKKIYEFQKRILQAEKKILPLLEFYSLGASLTFNYMSLGQAFEIAVLEYPFSFFQWGFDCENIPDEKASYTELTRYLLKTSNIDFLSDYSIKYYGPHYYQSAHEMGYYGYDISNFKKLLKYLPTDTNPHAAYIPDKEEVKFNDSLLKAIHPWLSENGHRFVYIYGEMDTWSASAVPPNEKVDALWFFMKGKNHGNARIRSMSNEERLSLITKLEQWLELEIE